VQCLPGAFALNGLRENGDTAEFRGIFRARVYIVYRCSMNSPPDSLSEALQGWRVAPPANPNFRHHVWQRIGKRPETSWLAYLRSHAAGLSLASVIVLGVAAYSGSALAHSQVRADREAIVRTYLVDLDPRIQAVVKP
jgi:hypothetical protein